MAALWCRVPSWGASSVEQRRMSMSVCLGGVALRGLDFGLMDSSMVALSGIVAMPTADRFCKVMV